MIPIYVSFGYEETRLRQGWTAGVCPFCETLQPHEVFEVYRETLLYHINVDDTSRVWTLVRCDFCLFSYVVFQRDQIIVDAAWTPAQGVAALVARTNPDLTQAADSLLRLKRPTTEEFQRMLRAVERYSRIPNEPATQAYLAAGAFGAGLALLGYVTGRALSLEPADLSISLAVVAGGAGALVGFIGMTMAMRKKVKVQVMARHLQGIAARHRFNRNVLMTALGRSPHRGALLRQAIDAAYPAN